MGFNIKFFHERHNETIICFHLTSFSFLKKKHTPKKLIMKLKCRTQETLNLSMYAKISTHTTKHIYQCNMSLLRCQVSHMACHLSHVTKTNSHSNKAFKKKERIIVFEIGVIVLIIYFKKNCLHNQVLFN